MHRNRSGSSFPAIPVELSRIVSKMMNKAVEQRYQNADDLIGDLTRFRRFLAQYKKQLREEARRTLSQVTDLAHQNEELFSREGISSPSKRLTDSLERDDVSYMSLVGLKDGASLHLRRLEKLVESAARASARDSDRTLSIYEATWTGMRPMSGAEQRDAIRADEKLEAAETSFSTGDLAGSLRLVCDALRIAPAHQRAEQLAERIRIGIVRLADVLAPPPGPTQVEVLVAALLAIGETGAEQAMLQQRIEPRSSNHRGFERRVPLRASIRAASENGIRHRKLAGLLESWLLERRHDVSSEPREFLKSVSAASLLPVERTMVGGRWVHEA